MSPTPGRPARRATVRRATIPRTATHPIEEFR